MLPPRDVVKEEAACRERERLSRLNSQHDATSLRSESVQLLSVYQSHSQGKCDGKQRIVVVKACDKSRLRTMRAETTEDRGREGL